MARFWLLGNQFLVAEKSRKENEKAWRTEEAIDGHALRIWEEIKDCIYRGAHKEGILPGGLFVKRRAYDLNLKLIGELKYSTKNEWLQCIRNSGTSFSAINKCHYYYEDHQVVKHSLVMSFIYIHVY